MIARFRLSPLRAIRWNWILLVSVKRDQNPFVRNSSDKLSLLKVNCVNSFHFEGIRFWFLQAFKENVMKASSVHSWNSHKAIWTLILIIFLPAIFFFFLWNMNSTHSEHSWRTGLLCSKRLYNQPYMYNTTRSRWISRFHFLVSWRRGNELTNERVFIFQEHERF